MLYTYILNKNKLSHYFPETKNFSEQEYQGTNFSELTCVQSNRWLDIRDEDKYIPLCFKTEKELEHYRVELMKNYIEYKTQTKNIELVPYRKIGSELFEYHCYVGDSKLYVTEKDAYEMKENMSCFEKGYFFLSLDSGRARVHPEALSMEGVWYTKGKIDKVNDYKPLNDVSASLIMNMESDNGIFRDVKNHHIPMLKQISDRQLPKIKVERKKWFGLVDNLLKKEDPLYTPVKLKRCLEKGEFHFGDISSFLKTLSETEDDKTKSFVTDKPDDFVFTLRQNGVPYLMNGGKNGIFEITYLDGDDDMEHFENTINMTLMSSCKNYSQLQDLPDLKKLDVMVDQGYGICVDDDHMIFSNPNTDNTLPFQTIHSLNCYKYGLQNPSLDYDPHKNVNIKVPVEIVIESIDKCHVLIGIKTHKEEVFIDENFPLEQRIGEKEIMRELLKKLWKKGYLLNDYGLANLHYHQNYETGCIQKPWWFRSDTQEESQKLIRFISQIF